MKQVCCDYSSSDSSRPPRLLMAQQRAQKDSAKKNDRGSGRRRVRQRACAASGSTACLPRSSRRRPTARRRSRTGRRNGKRHLRRRLSRTRPRPSRATRPKLPPGRKGLHRREAARRFFPDVHRSNRSPRRRRVSRDPSVRDQVHPRARSVRRGRAADRPRHRHRADARGVRDDRARGRNSTSRRFSSCTTARACASWRAAGKGFGIVAGTGTGKTLAIRPIAEEILRTDELKVGVVNREREATPETPTWNVIIVTTGIARRWFEEGDILAARHDRRRRDPPDVRRARALSRARQARRLPIHLAVGDGESRRSTPGTSTRPTCSRSTTSIPTKAAQVQASCASRRWSFSTTRSSGSSAKQRRGVALFVPTRRGVEEAADHVRRCGAAHQHGVLPRRRTDPHHPAVSRGRREEAVLPRDDRGRTERAQRARPRHGDHRRREVLQRRSIAGATCSRRSTSARTRSCRWPGACTGASRAGACSFSRTATSSSTRSQPTEPEFQLAGDSERVAMTCAALGVRADELDLPVPLDRVAYRRALDAARASAGSSSTDGSRRTDAPSRRCRSSARGPSCSSTRTTSCCRISRVMSSVESLHRMTREERDLDGLIVPGSDHLTAYNLYAEAYRRAGSMGRCTACRATCSTKSASSGGPSDAARSSSRSRTRRSGWRASIARSASPLPARMTSAGERNAARVPATARRVHAVHARDRRAERRRATRRASRRRACAAAGVRSPATCATSPTSSEIRARRSRGRRSRTTCCGSYATVTEGELVYDPDSRRSPLVLRRRVEYHGFELEREIEPIDEFPPAIADAGEARTRRSAGAWRGAASRRAREPGRDRVDSRDVSALRRQDRRD